MVSDANNIANDVSLSSGLQILSIENADYFCRYKKWSLMNLL